MDKIQKALEKSWLERDRDQAAQRREGSAPARPSPPVNGVPATRQGSAPSPTVQQPVRTGPTRSPMPVPAADETDQIADISYTQTRVNPITPKGLEKRRLIAGLPQHAYADTFRILRTRVLQRMEQNGYRTIGVLSSVGQEGKSLVASNLAISLANILTRTVLLVDLDLRAPSIHTYFGVSPEPGLMGYLREGRALSDCLVNPGIDRLVLLPNGRPAINSAELLTMPRMTGLAKELRETYRDRVIIYDLAPLLHTDDALAFMHHIDCCLMVASEGRTTENELKQAVSLLKGHKLIGTVMNRSTETAKHVKKSRATR
ncbi:exopolysaccharide biosynthesis protein [Roseospira navarrensis]|uniref:Exopolysaccharide biosynthesis protein n=1 Tax=Roseospira navarrensis TaxID=140058 RepID=A0A7X1ZB85_9PROT|nr:exopolysaccharide biosynthesis protein [Roseospira navarrensis]MQX35345.1 exopolysaccharide biosynthesis protein [Roseospira navarrensis]